jgi:hypothetical protein
LATTIQRCCHCLLVVALASPADAAPRVWAIDDGEKIKQDEIGLPLARGEGNPVFDGQRIRLFALRNETVAVQIVVEADGAPLEGVTVDLERLERGEAVIANAPGANDPTRFVGRRIERFVEHLLPVRKPSGGGYRDASLGWTEGSGPPPQRWIGRVPDPLIPVEVAPPWSPYPLAIRARENGIVWIDVTVPPEQPPGLYRGAVVVAAAGRALASLPVELEVLDATLPDSTVGTMLFYARWALDKRIGDGARAERHLWQLLHRHRVAPLHGAMTVDDVRRHAAALDGTLYTPEQGYEGPGIGTGDGVLSLGTYGGFGAPDAADLAAVEAIAAELAARRLFERTVVFVYAVDEECESPYGRAWKSLLAKSRSPHVAPIRVGWTCSEDPVTQPVDIPMMWASLDPARVARARAAGKEVWIYNGRRPQSGAFLTDVEAVSPRVNGWLAAMYGIPRWFYWESVFWYDGNAGGKGPYDPFATAETFHNRAGESAMGDGVLLYPGKQVDRFVEHSIGMDGVIASIRLKNWRRGLQDAGYLQLARAADPRRAAAIAAKLIPRALDAARAGDAPSWSERGLPFFEARKALAALIPRGRDGGPRASPSPAAVSGFDLPSASPDWRVHLHRFGRRKAAAIAAALALGVAGIAFVLVRSRRRRVRASG